MEEFSRDLHGWYDVNIYCPEPGKVAVMYTNTTRRGKSVTAKPRD
jgi:hypothetical protein